MESFMKTIFVFAILCFSVFVQASPGDYYVWNSSGVCLQLTAPGYVVAEVPDHNCPGSNYYTWSSDGICFLSNAHGKHLAKVSDSYCPGNDYYSWNKRERLCYVLNGYGRIVRTVPEVNCQSVR